jgi:hypothetical protein
MRRVCDRVADEGTKRGFGAEPLPEYDETKPCADIGRAAAKPPPPLGVCAAALVGAKFRNERASFAAAEWSPRPVGELSKPAWAEHAAESPNKNGHHTRAHARTHANSHTHRHACAHAHARATARTHG